jgi:hypothetical protein
VKLEVPLAVGAPEITPAAESVSPAGRLPCETDHVYAGVPPLAFTVWEKPTPTVAGGKLKGAITRADGAIEMVMGAEVA